MKGVKKTKIQSKKIISMLEEIGRLKKCISGCEGKLSTAYKNGIAKNKKQGNLLNSKLRKTKEQLKIAKDKQKHVIAQKKTKSTKSIVARVKKAAELVKKYNSVITELQKKKDNCSQEISIMNEGLKQFEADQKNRAKFAKEWAEKQLLIKKKRMKKPTTSKKKVTKKKSS